MDNIIIGSNSGTAVGAGAITIGQWGDWGDLASGYSNFSEPQPVEANISTINPNEQKLTVAGETEFRSETEFKSKAKFQNGIEISNSKCSGCCEEKGTIKCDEFSICIECITECVIQHKARTAWIEKNGDPIIKLQKQIDELKLKIEK